MGNTSSTSTSTDLGVVAGIIVAILVGFSAIAVIAYGTSTGALSGDAGMAIFLAAITATCFGLSSSIGSMSGTPQRNAQISLMAINGGAVAILGAYLWYTTAYKMKTTSVQGNQQFVLLIIPVTMIMSIVSLSATAMSQLSSKHCTT